MCTDGTTRVVTGPGGAGLPALFDLTGELTIVSLCTAPFLVKGRSYAVPLQALAGKHGEIVVLVEDEEACVVTAKAVT